jgi:hypothetical protein
VSALPPAEVIRGVGELRKFIALLGLTKHPNTRQPLQKYTILNGLLTHGEQKRGTI